MIGLSQEARIFAAKLHEAELTIKDHEQCNVRLLAENRKLKACLESLEKDAARHKHLTVALMFGVKGGGYGKRYKIVEICPVYGDEKIVSVDDVVYAAMQSANKGE